MEKQRTCKQRVAAHYANRLSDLRKLLDAQAKGEESVPDLGSLNEYGLGFDYVAPGTFQGQRRGYFRYQLSWGGPSDEFRFYCGPELEPYSIEYWFMDWFDGARIKVGPDSRNGKILMQLWQDWKDCEVVQHAYSEAMGEEGGAR